MRHYGPPRLRSVAAQPAGAGAGAGAAAAPRAERLGLAQTELGEGDQEVQRGLHAVCRSLPREERAGGNEPRVFTSLLASPRRCKAYSSSCSRGCLVGTGKMPLPRINGRPRSVSPPDLDVREVSEVLLCCSLPHLAPPYSIVRARGGRRGDGVSSAKRAGWFSATSQ